MSNSSIPRFQTVDDLLDFIPESELLVALHLREMVKLGLPKANEHLSYNVPFYKMNRNICFIWPASVLWGKRKTYEGVRFGFNQGFRMQDNDGILDRGKRKQVYWIDILNLEHFQANRVSLLQYLKEAELLDKHT